MSILPKNEYKRQTLSFFPLSNEWPYGLFSCAVNCKQLQSQRDNAELTEKCSQFFQSCQCLNNTQPRECLEKRPGRKKEGPPQTVAFGGLCHCPANFFQGRAAKKGRCQSRGVREENKNRQKYFEDLESNQDFCQEVRKYLEFRVATESKMSQVSKLYSAKVV